MGKYLASEPSKALADLIAMKRHGEKISMVTCYDAAFARLVEKAGVDAVLVGDSLGNVVLGFDNTISVTMAAMTHHCAAVARALKAPFLIADMPFGSYRDTKLALENAVRLLQEGGAQAVKLEGGAEIVPQTRALVSAGIPVVGHLGLTPQKVHSLSGYRVQGRGMLASERLMKDALELEGAGASMLVLELVPQNLAERVSKALSIPTIGIGAGPNTDGQVLVLHDLLGFDESFCPKFLKRYASIGESVAAAISEYHQDVKAKKFPTDKHSFS